MDWLIQAEKYENEMIKDLIALVNIPSITDEKTKTDNSPFGYQMRCVLDEALALGKRDGFKVKDVDGYVGVIEYGDNEEAIGVLGHLDVVPVSDGWKTDPFNAIVDEGYLFARGASDDKGPTIAAYYAMRLLKDNNIKLKRNIQLILGTDEESGMRCMQYYKSKEKLPLGGFVPDSVFPVVYAEKGIMNVSLHNKVDTVIKHLDAGQRVNIVIADAIAQVDKLPLNDLFNFYLKANDLKGELWQDASSSFYRIYGSGAHGARPYLGVNAAWHLFNFIGAAYHDEFASKTAFLLKDWMASNLNNRIEGVYLGNLTMNLGIVKIIDQHASLTLDIRYPNDIDEQIILSNINEAIAQQDYPLIATINTVKPPLFVNPESDMIKTLVDIYRKYTNDNFTPIMTMSGGTYARTLPNFVGYGAGFVNRKKPSHVGNAHENDEGIEIRSLVLACAIYAEALVKLTNIL